MRELRFELFRYASVFVCHSITLYQITDCRFGRGVCRWTWTGLAAGCLALTLALTFFAPVELLVMQVLLSAVTMLLNGAAYIFISRGPWQKALFVNSTYAAFFYLLLQMSHYGSALFFGGSVMTAIWMRNVFYVVIWLLIRRLRGFWAAATADIGRGWGSLAAYGLFTGVVIYVSTALFWLEGVDNLHGLIFCIAAAALTAAEYAAVIRMLDLQRREYALRDAEAQRKVLEVQLAAEREFVDQARAHRHDIRHHMTLLDDYLARNDVGGARNYLAQNRSQLERENLEVFCENHAANALLRLAARRCRETGCPCGISVVIPKGLPLSAPELAIVLGNVLENAWEANRRALTPCLEVRGFERSGSLLIEVENGVSGETAFSGDLPLTTKPGGGLGLKNAVRALEKHGGMLQCKRQGDRFCTRIILPL